MPAQAARPAASCRSSQAPRNLASWSAQQSESSLRGPIAALCRIANRETLEQGLTLFEELCQRSPRFESCPVRSITDIAQTVSGACGTASMSGQGETSGCDSDVRLRVEVSPRASMVTNC